MASGGGGRHPIRFSHRWQMESMMVQAVKHGDMDTLAQLLEGDGKDCIDAHAFHGKTALFMAVTKRHVGSCRLLLYAGADPNIPENGTGMTALHAAVLRDDHELVRMLTQHGADLQAQNCQGETALDLAKENNCSSCVAIINGDDECDHFDSMESNHIFDSQDSNSSEQFVIQSQIIDHISRDEDTADLHVGPSVSDTDAHDASTGATPKPS